MKQLQAETLQISNLSAHQKENMYALYADYYDATNEALFYDDLNGKDYVILLKHQENLKGFTTIKLLEVTFDESPIRVLYSGDTIIHHHFWGEQTLVRSWCEFSGNIKAQQLDIPLYWLLITKGHRTYRFLPAFFKQYHPQKNKQTPESTTLLIDDISTTLFDKAYHAQSGTLQFPVSKGQLQSKWADAEEYAQRHKHIAYFLSKNPGYAKGDELVCLTELSIHNMRSIALRSFEKGLAGNE